MDTQLRKQLQGILTAIFQKRENFYKIKYLKAGINKKDILNFNLDVFNQLPSVSQKEIANAPYKTRCLNEKTGLNKLVFLKEANKYILLHRTLEEITGTKFSVNGLRPLVLMEDLYEALEYCLYFYGQGILPLIGETINPPLLYLNALQYKVDLLVLDLSSKKLFQDGLLKLKLPLKSVVIIDSFFSPEGLIWPSKITCHYILALPEFGRIAFLCKESFKKGSFCFHSFEDVLVEPGKKTVLTSVGLKSCPMIRYQSNIGLELAGKCICKKDSLKII